MSHCHYLSSPSILSLKQESQLFIMSLEAVDHGLKEVYIFSFNLSYFMECLATEVSGLLQWSRSRKAFYH